MESSFKKGYDKTVNADGSVNISLTGKNRGAAQTSGYPVMYIMVFFICIFLGFKILDFFPKGWDRNVSGGALVFIWFAVSSGLWFVFYLGFKNMTSKKTNIVIKPSEGIIFNGKQLPFSDIQTIGVAHQTTTSNVDGNAQVYANSDGTNIEITGWLPLALAEAVAGDIKKSSGMNWH